MIFESYCLTSHFKTAPIELLTCTMYLPVADLSENIELFELLQ